MSEKKREPFISGEDIKVWRISRQISQKELGSFLGIGRTAVGELEKRGGDQILALALAAVDRGLSPAMVTLADRTAYKQTGDMPIRSKRAGSEDLEASEPRSTSLHG